MRILSKYLFIPLAERIAHGSTFERLKELERTQWWSKDELNQLQQKRLQSLIAHAYENVPFYGRVFQERGLTPADIKTVEDLTKLPILTKQDVREKFEQLIAKNYDRKGMKLESTSGSTGEPLRVLKPKELGWSWGAHYRGLRWYGFEPGDKWAQLTGGTFNISFAHKLLLKIGRLLRRATFLSTLDLSKKQMERFTAKLRRFQPKLMITYPSAVYILAEHIRHLGIQDIRPKVVITTAEKLYEHQRQTIKEVFGCDVFEYYGCVEVVAIAYECPEHQGYHVSTENVILEIVKDDNQASPPGEMGRIIVTDLRNYAMPFIRYENGDLGILSDERCSCGRSLPLLKSVEGRITEIITSEKGYLLAPDLHDSIFMNLPVKQYQVIQERTDEILIKIVKGDGYSQKDTDYILGTMHKYTGGNMKIQAEFVDSIPPTEAGKRRVVISKVPKGCPTQKFAKVRLGDTSDANSE